MTAEIGEKSKCSWRSPRLRLQMRLLALSSFALSMFSSSSLFPDCAVSSHLSPPDYSPLLARFFFLIVIVFSCLVPLPRQFQIRTNFNFLFQIASQLQKILSLMHSLFTFPYQSFSCLTLFCIATALVYFGVLLAVLFGTFVVPHFAIQSSPYIQKLQFAID